MPDPIEELENFTAPGLTMTPLSASEVRRRGARIRRRNNALAGVGALAAVAVIATPFAVFAGNNTSSTPDPAPPVTQWRQEIPSGFPLADRLYSDPAVSEDAGVELIEPCGRTAWSADAPVTTVDLAGAVYKDGEHGAGRTLALYGDDRSAGRALGEIESAIAACPVEPNGRGFDQRLDVAAADLGEESVVITQRSVDENGDLAGEMTVVQAVRVGNALLFASTWGEGGSSDEMAAQVSGDLAQETSGVVDAMCTFSAAGCADQDGATDRPLQGEGAVPAIPEDFPLADGLPADREAIDRKGFGRLDETAGLRPIAPSACGQTAGDTGDVVEMARAEWRDVGESRGRQVMTFPRQAEAQAYVDAVTSVFCPEDELGGGVTRLSTVYGGDLGDIALVAVARTEVDGEPGPGLSLTHVVRVGRAVLVAQTVDETYEWQGDVERVGQELVDASTAEIDGVVAAMCTFTDTGC